MAVDIQETTDNKITYSETITHDEASLVEEYRRCGMERKVCENVLNQAPHMIEATKAQIQMREWEIKASEGKAKRLKEVLSDKNIDFKSAIEQIRAKYTDQEILDKTQNVIGQSRTEIKKVGDKYEITTTTTNDPDDMLIELMSIENNIPHIIELKLKDEEILKNTQKRVANTEEMIKKVNEKSWRIKEFFAGRHKDIDKLLDAQAVNRDSKKKIAEKLPNV